MTGRALRLLAPGLFALLAGCSILPPSIPLIGARAEKPKPAELQANPNLLAVRQAWTAQVGAVDFPLVVTVSGNVVAVAASNGLTDLKPVGTERTEKSVTKTNKALSEERSSEVKSATPEKNIQWSNYSEREIDNGKKKSK